MLLGTLSVCLQTEKRLKAEPSGWRWGRKIEK